MSTKAIKTWEKERGIIIVADDIDLDKRVTEDEINELITTKLNEGGGQIVGVNHEDRTQFLKENGYEVTRENLINGNLSRKEAAE